MVGESRALRVGSRGSHRVDLRGQQGFGLIELMIAMVVLSVGLLGVVGAFAAGQVSLRRASHLTTAMALAESQMELYRALTYNEIALDSTLLATADATYKTDLHYVPAGPLRPEWDRTKAPFTSGPYNGATCATFLGGNAAQACKPSQTGVIGPDQYIYRLDTYVALASVGAGRQLKQVTVVVRDGRSLAALATAQTTFDQATSCPAAPQPC